MGKSTNRAKINIMESSFTLQSKSDVLIVCKALMSKHFKESKVINRVKNKNVQKELNFSY